MSRLRVAGAALSTAVAIGLSFAKDAPTAFPPLDNWKAAVISGDQPRLARLYSSDPPAKAFVSKVPVPNLSDELAYWVRLKSAGVTSLDPKVLSLKQAGDQETVLLRISAVKGSEAAVGGAQNLVASMLQVWVKQAGGWRMAVSQRSEFQLDHGRRLPEPAKPNPALYPDPIEARSELKAALALAGKEHKRVLVIFGANWCYDCHVLDATFRSKDFSPLLTPNFIPIHINTGDEGKDNNDLAAQLGVNLDHGIPSLAVLDPNGHVVVAQQNGEFESTVRIGPEEVRAFLQKWAPARKPASQTNH